MDKRIKNPIKSPVFNEVKKDSKTMDFNGAIRMILKGKNIRKLDWKKGWFASLYKEDATLALIDADGEIHSWMISEGDLIGKDYVEA